jgi:hypothetical protein
MGLQKPRLTRKHGGCGPSQLAEGLVGRCIDVCDERRPSCKEGYPISVRQCPLNVETSRQLRATSSHSPPTGEWVN